MNIDAVDDYGWQDEGGLQSSGYIAPAVVATVTGLGAHRVCDIGAGNGHLCSLLAQAGLTVAGVEYDPHGVDIARQAHPSIPFFCMGVQDDPSPVLEACGAFDVVVSTEVIEHLYSPHHLPIFASKLLKPGGHLVVTTPYHGYAKNLLLSVFNKWDHHHTALWHGGHIKFWSRATLTKLLARVGFVDLRFRGVGRAPLLWKSMIVTGRVAAGPNSRAA